MTKKWAEVIATPEFRALKPEDQEAARAQYFAEVVAPQVPKDQVDAARSQFDAEYGIGGSQVQAPAAPQRSTGQEIARQLGLTVRHSIAGLTALPGMAADVLGAAYNKTADAVAGENNGFRFLPTSVALQRNMTTAGLPAPETATERVVGDAAGAMAGAGASAAVGKVLSGSASSVAANVGTKLQQGMGAQTAAAASGGTAAGVTRENGGGIGAQIAAGVIGSLLPGGAPALAREGTRRLLRGGEEGRQRVEQAVQLFDEAAGTTPSLAQATQGRVATALESGLAKVPGGAGVISKFAQRQADDMQAAVQKLSDDLAPGASAVNAGEAIKRGVETFKRGFNEVQAGLYEELGELLPKGQPIAVDRTRQALAEMNAGIEGAPNLSKWFKNAKIQGIEKALGDDLNLSTQVPGQSSVMPMASPPPALPYEAIKKLRTLVGKEITDGSLVSDVPRSKWRALYGALSEDLGDAAKAAGPRAEEAWAKANDYTSKHMQRLEELSGIVGRDAPEKVFSAAIAGTAEGDTIIKRVMSALPLEERNQVAAAVLQRMGRATAGQQNAMGDAFSPETFLTSLAKMSPPARQTIFGATSSDDLLKRLGQIAKISETRREGSKVFANPSGTAGAGAQIAVGSGLGTAGVHALSTGDVLPVLAATAPIVGSNLAARVMTSPRVLRMAASRTQLSDGAPAVAVGAASRLNSAGDLDPSERAVGEVYMTPRGRFVWLGNGWGPAR
ncbi:hypothetical protein CS062_16255 [Roseateles chitinivorans]|uniref:Uncharacterized protein n=1 Tax=Roseateles chitinivorans TaxID=2917965 RepID=A0A2G9C6Q3_9BURK|nr:hypothetical protein [Roseateles chitinivorans]PIM52106.1 hypothetical protein CS062_16255 [Roseateles chitinivorans]